jgi:hypothetical protein
MQLLALGMIEQPKLARIIASHQSLKKSHSAGTLLAQRKPRSGAGPFAGIKPGIKQEGIRCLHPFGRSPGDRDFLGSFLGSRPPPGLCSG